MIGKILGGRYEILEQIGEGGMSIVYKAMDKKLNRNVAAKVLKSEFSDNADVVKKFKIEATAIATLSDNNIVNIKIIIVEINKIFDLDFISLSAPYDTTMIPLRNYWVNTVML